MMYTSLEIEFKSKLTKDQYETLLKKYGLEDKVFKQTNYYFDTPDHKLINNHIILRIREKSYNIKLTSKTKQEIGTLEKHIVLEHDNAYKMIKEGFDASLIGINEKVINIASLTTYRAKTTYKNGTIFLDKNTYFDTTDYEIEFEATEIELGKKEFLEFLEENNLEYIKIVSKSKRAYEKSSQ